MINTTRTLVTLPPTGSAVHFVGIGGAGMIGLARILIEQGYRVSGSDRSDSPALATLRGLGAMVHVGHDAAFIGDAALVVITAAVRDDNAEVAAARGQDVPVIKRAALLGLLANARRCIAVAGSHGKSTTSGMIAYILSTLGHDPLFVIGAEVRDLGTSARNGAGPLAVVEADEYDYSFLHLTPDVAVITNIEYDHPDIFPDAETYVRAFATFASQIRRGGTLIVDADELAARVTSVAGGGLTSGHNSDAPAKSPGGSRLSSLPSLPGRQAGKPATTDNRALCPDVSDGRLTETVGTGADAPWRIILDPEGRMCLSHKGDLVGCVTLAVAGAHNARNAAMAVAACAAVGVDPRDALETVAACRGVGRRFEVVGEAGGVTVVDDYAHHPTEVRATLDAARSRYPGRRIIAVFQPHTFSRSALYAREFAAALSEADLAIVTDLYAAREPDLGLIHARDIAADVADGHGIYGGDLDATVEAVAERVRVGDVVLTLGAGDITTVGPRVLRLLAANEVSR